VRVDPSGNYYIADSQNNCIREVSTSGTIMTVAGTGTAGYNGDGIAATAAELNFPTGVALDSLGNLYIADAYNQRIRKVSGGIITTVAGIGPPAGYFGDGGLATAAQLNFPWGVACDSSGNFYIADAGNNRIREVSGGIINFVAGNGTAVFSGDGGAATLAGIDYPTGVAFDSSGNMYIAENLGNRIRMVSGGIIHTVAGNAPFGTAGYSGDGGAATSALLFNPSDVALDSSGNFYIADRYNQRIRKVSGGIITTVAGNGTGGYSGDGGAAVSAQLSVPAGVALDSGNHLYISDGGNNVIRLVP
jgi:sugar lactone lactonase YvrE